MKNIFLLVITLFLIHPKVFAQKTELIIEGFIKDDKGVPVAGASILVKGSNAYTTTDSLGKFRINPKRDFPFTIELSLVGFQTQEIVLDKQPSEPLAITFIEDSLLEEVVVTSRRRKEVLQEIPIPISVVSGASIEEAGAFNVNRVKELIPTVQLYSSNPRNTTLNIRGLGSTFGLTNDGIDPGVGFYVDGVYYARPAATALDFVDIEQIEVLRGPQGTLFGKNTTAGAFNIKTRAPSFKPNANFEVSYGNYRFIQAKASLTGALSKKLAGRLSFSGTQRDGLLYNVTTQKHVNNLNNLGARAQLLYLPNKSTEITLIGDFSTQRPDGYAQVVAGVAPTLRPAYRQFAQIIADLNYSLPSTNPFDRVIDHNTTWKSGNDLGGVSLNVDTKIGTGTLTSTTAWRFWNWDPSNDRDFTALPVLSLSQATSKHEQWSQEVRYAGEISSKITGVVGLYAIGQRLWSSPYHIEESGSAQWRFSQSSTSQLWKTPGLFEGFGIKTRSTMNSLSGAAFGQIDWAVTKELHILPGIRYNYDQKDVDFNRETYGGLQTDDPALLALKNAVYTNQAFTAKVDNSNFSGQLTVAWRPSTNIHTFATYSIGYKPIGVNLGGLPTANGAVLTDLARIKPEYVNHAEIGIKTNPTEHTTLNVTAYNTEIRDYQTQVQTAEIGVNRGYLANAEKVRVFGMEVDGNWKVSKWFSVYGNLAYTNGTYVSFKNAPVPLEETGGTNAFKDISGETLPGISKWAGSVGGEFTQSGRVLGKTGKFFIASDGYYRSGFSSSPSPSKYLNISEYALFNARLGFRAISGFSVFVWGRNILNKDYFEQLLPAAGNAGHYAGVLGDPRTYGITLRNTF